MPPFFTTKPRDKGTDLGLAISHGIVKVHKSRLTVETEPVRSRAFTWTSGRIMRERDCGIAGCHS
jgi:C4-dicarboxylate-specific signal transduction histidine kinase